METTTEEQAIIQQVPEHFRLNLPHRMRDVLARVAERRINPKTGSPESISDIVVEITMEERKAARELRDQLATPVMGGTNIPRMRADGVEVRNDAGEFVPIPADQVDDDEEPVELDDLDDDE